MNVSFGPLSSETRTSVPGQPKYRQSACFARAETNPRALGSELSNCATLAFEQRVVGLATVI